MVNDWDAYRRHFHDIMSDSPSIPVLVPRLAALRSENGGEFDRHLHEVQAYIKKLRRRHGSDGVSVVIEDLAIRIARLGAGIAESAVYGEQS